MRTTMRRLREAQGLTQQQLADQIGVDVKTINNFETGSRWPNRESRSALEQHFGWEAGSMQTTASRFISGNEKTAGPPFTGDPAGSRLVDLDTMIQQAIGAYNLLTALSANMAAHENWAGVRRIKTAIDVLLDERDALEAESHSSTATPNPE